MTRTPNYNLNKIATSDVILDDVNALSENATLIDTALAGKQNTLTAGTNITISNNTISVDNDLQNYDNNGTNFVNQTELNNAISQISIAGAFTYKGDVPDVATLPASNNQIGDIYYVVGTLSFWYWFYADTSAMTGGMWREIGKTMQTITASYITLHDVDPRNLYINIR